MVSRGPGVSAAIAGVTSLTGRASVRPSPVTAKRCHSSGTPFSVCVPRSANSRPEPSTSSRTVLDTNTSPALACATIRAATLTANPREIVTSTVALAGMNPGAHLNSQRSDSVTHRSSTADRPRRTFEHSEETIAERLDRPTPVALDLDADDLVVAFDQCPPALVSHLGGSLCRGDDVGEQDRRQGTIGVAPVTGAGQELLDLVDDRLPVPDPDEVIPAWEDGQLRPRDLLCEIPTEFDRNKAVLAIDDQRRRRDPRQRCSDVHVKTRFEQCHRHPGAGTDPFGAAEHLRRTGNGDRARSPQGEDAAVTPTLHVSRMTVHGC